jgi:hypothetical protein
MQNREEVFSVEEFLAHLKDARQFMNYQHLTVRGEVVEFPNKPSSHSMRWLYDEYLKDSGYAAKERMRRIAIFCGIHEYLAHHEEFFRKKDFIKEDEANRRPKISEDLFRAVHWFATAKRTHLSADSVDPRAVLDLAKAFKKARTELKTAASKD